MYRSTTTWMESRGRRGVDTTSKRVFAAFWEGQDNSGRPAAKEDQTREIKCLLFLEGSGYLVVDPPFVAKEDQKRWENVFFFNHIRLCFYIDKT